MARPSLRDTSDWHTSYDSDLVTIERATLTTRDGFVHRHGAYRVTIKPHQDQRRRGPDGGPVMVAKSSKLFYGETAWSDAERMASDVDFGAIGGA